MALKCRMRLYETRQISRFVNSNKNIPMGVLAGKCKLLEIIMNGATGAAIAEIDPVSAKMQLATADLMEFKSSDNLDNSSGTGALAKFNAIVVDANDEPKNLELAMHAVTGTTLVHTDETLKDCWHINAVEWGSHDLDAEGNVDMEKEDSTAICTIAAAANEGNGSGFLIPAGWKACLLEGRLEAVGAQAADEGKIFTLIFNDAVDLATDVRVLNSMSWTIYGVVLTIKIDCNRIFQAGTELTMWISRVDDGNEDFHVRLYFLLWEA